MLKRASVLLVLVVLTQITKAGDMEIGRQYTLSTGGALSRIQGTNSSIRILPRADFFIDNYLTDSRGTFLGVGYANRGFLVGGRSSSAHFIDVPFGFSQRWHWLGGVTENRAGGVVGLPLSDFEGDLPLTFSNDSRTFFGLYLDFGTKYAISDGGTSLGYRIWIKNGLTDVFPTAARGRGEVQELGVALELGF